MGQTTPPSSAPELTLHDWACLRTELVWVYDQQIDPSYSDRHDDFSVGHRAWYVRRGRVEVKGPGQRTLRAGPGMWLFPAPDRARQLISPDTHLLSIQFLCQWPSGDSLFEERPGQTIQGALCPDLENKAMLLASRVGNRFPTSRTGYGLERADYSFFLEAQTLFFNWLIEWVRVRLQHGASISPLMPGDDRVAMAVRCLNEWPMDAEFPGAQLQKLTRLGEAHLNRLFLRALGMTTRKYRERQKLEFAKSCLESSVMPVKEIAWRLGFKSNSHFVIWFRRLSGRRPGEFRAQSIHQAFSRSPVGGCPQKR